jgi:hypothetical protein
VSLDRGSSVRKMKVVENTNQTFFLLVMSIGPTRPIHTAALQGDLGEVTRLLDLGESVDPRNEVSLCLSVSLISYHRMDTPLSSGPVPMVIPM